ncbi:MAG: shikimate dehydrogenase [Desulfotomaculaceae bacterium]|nr:shikimate dehydrogenase [Desulfotomaculaceae bacterium]
MRKFPLAKGMPQILLDRVTRLLPPLKVSEITGVRSSYNECCGEFIGCTLNSRQLLEMPEKKVIEKISAYVRLATKNGAKIVGLGALTSVVGDAGITVANNTDIPVTTGNSYTIYTALEGVKYAAKKMGIGFNKAKIVILGATGSIGSVCAQLVARENKDLTLIARRKPELGKLRAKIMYDTGVAVKISNDGGALQEADIIIAVSASLDYQIHPADIKPGAVICDVARPRDVSPAVAKERDDVLVMEGGVVDVPGEPQFNFDFGFPSGKCYACMAETMILALEKQYESYSLGRDITIDKVLAIGELSKKHGFKLAGLRSFERSLTEEKIAAIKKAADTRRNNTGVVSAVND